MTWPFLFNNMQPSIIINSTLDWGNISDQDFINHAFQFAHPEETKHYVALNLDHWSKFPITYTQFRAKLKEIAQSTWAKLSCPIRTFHPVTPATLARNTWDLYHTGQGQSIYFPTDDDDWYHPNILQEVLPIFKQNPHVRFVVWDCWLYALLYTHEEYLPRPLGFTGSNGFAMRGVRLANFDGGHLYVDDIIRRQPEKVAYLQKPLSVWVRHVGAFSQLSAYPMPQSCGNMQRQPHPEFLEWARPYMDQVFALTTMLIPQ